MKKLLFGITSLELGGAERVLVDITNQLCEEYDITIFTIYAKGELEKELSPKIKRKSLYTVSYQELSKFQKHIGIPLKILLQNKKIYQKNIKENYDVEIAFLEGVITRLFSNKNKTAKKIAWVHNDIACVFGKGIKAKLKRKIDKKIYNKYKTLIFVSNDNLESFQQEYPEIKNKKQVIYNYIDQEKIIKKAKEKIEEKFEENTINLVTVARLVEQKAIDRLIKVHKKLIKEGLSHNFYVIGDGPEKEKLQNLMQKEKVEKTFKLLGKRKNPYPYIKKADYFCLFSKFEGYGMVIEEAKILNKPILITDTAAKEAVKNYENCKIAPNSEEGIYHVVKEVLNQKTKSKTINSKYQNEDILKQIKKLI